MRQERNGKNKTKDMFQQMFLNKRENTKIQTVSLTERKAQGGGFKRIQNLGILRFLAVFSIVLGSFFIFGAGRASAATYYVSPTGSNTAPYDTWEKAANTFKAANTAASAGDTLVLDYGNHVISGFVGIKSVSVVNRYLSNDWTVSTFTYDAANVLSRIDVAGTSPTFTGVTFSGQPHDYSAVNIQSNTTGSTQAITFNYCLFTGNGAGTSNLGGAIRGINSTNRNNLIISNSRFESNQSVAGGGAIGTGENVFMTLSDSTFIGNFITPGNQSNGGALYLRSTSGATASSITDCTFTENLAGNNGGAIFIADTDVTVTDCTFMENEANYEETEGSDGSAALSINRWRTNGTSESPEITTVTVSGSMFDGNFCNPRLDGVENTVATALSTGDGGGLMAFGYDPYNRILVNVTDTTFQNNHAMQGAGAYISRYANANFTRVKFLNNIAFSFAGGSARGGANSDCEGDTSTYTSCIFSGNRAGYNRNGTANDLTEANVEGGGLGVRVYPKVILENCSFSNNYVRSGGTGDAIKNGAQPNGTSMTTNNMRSSLTNVAVWNDPGIGNDVLIRSGDNGWTEISFSSYSNGQSLGAGIVPDNIATLSASPFLSSSNFNLQSTSPAIDAGTDVSLTTDYAGFPIYGLPDIGAYEYQPPYTVGTAAIPKTGSIRIYSNGKYRALIASTTAETISTANFSVTPSGGSWYTASTSAYMDISITEWSTTGAKNKSWIATSSATAVGQTHATSTIHTIGDLLASTYYTFKIDNIATTTAITGYGSTTCQTSYGNGTNLTCLSDSSGIIQFTYSGGYSTHTFSLEKDTAAPSSFTLSSPADNTVSTEARPALSWNAASDTESGIAKYRLYIDNTLDTDNIANTATSQHPTQNFSCGAHTWYIAALDNNGNTTNSNTQTYTRDCNTIPVYLLNQQNQSGRSVNNGSDDSETGDKSSDDSPVVDTGDSSGTADNASEGSDDNKNSGNSNSENPKTTTPALETLQSEAKAIVSKAKDALTNFITAGTGTTKILGSGERSGVINSFKSAFGRNPATEIDWTDIVKIANGRWPGQKNAVTEKNAEAAFRKIYLREPEKDNPHDKNAIAVISYGLRPTNRNLNSEKQAIKSFKFIYGYAPKSTTAWDVVRAIAYSGAKR